MDLAVYFAILVIGFGLGYSVRAAISQHRRSIAIRRRVV
jgi:hypothetical protein